MAESVNEQIVTDVMYDKYNDSYSRSKAYLHLLSTRMFDLLNTGILCDTTLVTSDQEILAHSIVLAAASNVFQTALSSFAGNTSSYRLELIGLSSRTMTDILRLIYTGSLQTDMNEEEHTKLVDVCLQLGLDFIEPNINIINIRNICLKNEKLSEDTNPIGIASDATEQDLQSRIETSSNNTDTINAVHLKELVDDTALNLLRLDEANGPNEGLSINNQENNNSTECHSCDRCGQLFINSSMLLLHKEECLLHFAETPTDSSGLGVSSESGSLTPFVFELVNVDLENPLEHADDDYSDVTNANDQDQNESSGLGFYNCSDCDRQFQFASLLHAHMRRHTDTRPYECTVCGRRFRDNCLRTHMLTHTGERPHECVQCTKTFSRAADLVVHLKTHTGVKAHICELCDRAFTKKGDLQRHMRVHSGERPYVCEECGKAFKILFHLRLHSSVHKATRGYSCELCPKAFGNSAQLRKHVKIHSGERPHACDVCLRRFNRAANLRAHMKVHEVRHSSLPSGMADDVNPSEGDYDVNGDLVYCKIEPSEQHDVLVALPYGVIEGFTHVNDTSS